MRSVANRHIYTTWQRLVTTGWWIRWDYIPNTGFGLGSALGMGESFRVAGPVNSASLVFIMLEIVQFRSNLERCTGQERVLFRINKLTDYATMVLSAMAGHDDQIHSAQQLAADCHLETPTTSKVLKLLAAAGLVESFRGAQGGYRLARSGAEISVADVLRAVEGPIGITECAAEPGLCSHESVCNLRGNWRRIAFAVEQALEEVSVADMARPLTAAQAMNLRFEPLEPTHE